MAANTEHDEEYNRLHWRPTECSPELESRRAPVRPPFRGRMVYLPELGISVLAGSMNAGAAHVKTSGRKTYR